MCKRTYSMIEWALGLWLWLLRCCSPWFYGPNSIISLRFNFSPSTLQPESPGGGGRERVPAQSLEATCHSKILTRAKPAHLLLHQRRRSPTLWLSSPDALRVGGLSFESIKFIRKCARAVPAVRGPRRCPSEGKGKAEVR